VTGKAGVDSVDGMLQRLALARASVDRAGIRWTDDAWLAVRWAHPASLAVRVHEGRTPVREGRLVLVPTTEAGSGTTYFLGVDEQDIAYFGVATKDPIADAEGVDLLDLRAVGGLLDDRDAGLLVHAIALANWHAAHGFCSKCGHPTDVVSAGHVRRCPNCGTEHYPRTDPAVIVLVTDPDDRALLGHNPAWPEGRFSTLAGFVEPGESAEMAVVREIAEEAGVHLTDVRYLGSQPWPFPWSLMLGYTARAADPSTLAPDGEEISELRWFTRQQLADAMSSGEVLPPGGISIARRLVEHWYGGPLPEPPA
jgi:NAD+ diphosphatase